MAVWSVIQKSQLEGAIRLDSEYYQPEYLTLMDSLKKNPTVQLNSIAFVTDGIHASIDYDNKSNIRCLSAQYLQDNYFDLSANTFISENQHKMNLRTSLKAGDVILSSVGTIGNCAVVTEDILPANADRHVAIIRLSEGEFSPFYLSVFFNSKYGKFQTIREATGNVQLNLFIDKIKTLKIPVLKKHEEIHELSKKSCDMIYLANALYSQAENLLLEELGLKDFKPQEDLSYVVNLSDVKSARRADADYFQPKYDRMEKKLIKEFDSPKIKYLYFIKVTTGQYCDEYVQKNEGKAYIRGTDLTNGTVNVDALVYIKPQKQMTSKKAKEGDVVVTRVGTIGTSARLPKEVEGGTISDNLIRMRFPEEALNSFYVTLFFNTVGSQLMIRESRGSVQARLNQETLKEIVLPVLPIKIQQKIANLVQQSHEARNIAKELLEEAKRKVDEAIENN